MEHQSQLCLIMLRINTVGLPSCMLKMHNQLELPGNRKHVVIIFGSIIYGINDVKPKTPSFYNSAILAVASAPSC